MWLPVWYNGWNSSNLYTTPSTHHLNQFQPAYHIIHTSPTSTYNQHTTSYTHHVHLVPTGIQHRPHITYNQYQPVYHTVHTSPNLVTTSVQHSPHIT